MSAFGYISTVEAIDFLDAYKEETEFYVISDILYNLDELKYTLRGTSIANKFDSYCLSLFKKLFTKVSIFFSQAENNFFSRLDGQIPIWKTSNLDFVVN